MKVKETYQQFCEQHRLTPGPEAAKAYAEDVLALAELKRHYDDEFIASLNPDGGNIAGFHGVGESDE